MVECKYCSVDSPKRHVLIHKPLKKLPTDDLPEGVNEFYCSNIVLIRRKHGRNQYGNMQYTWLEEECRNHILTNNGGDIN